MKLRPLLVLTLTFAAAACAPNGDRDEAAVAADAAALPTDSGAARPAGMPGGEAAPSARGPAADAVPDETVAPDGSASPAAREQAADQAALSGDSATRILERASARYEAVRSLQADFTMAYENPLLRSRTSGRGVLYQKRPDRLLLRFSEPAGDVIMSDGRYFWVYYPSVDVAQVLRSEASAGSSSGVDLQAQFLGDPTRRFEYALTGRDTVGGRPAWQLTLKPREPMGYRQLRVWIDQADYLARRFEIVEDNGSIRRFDLRGLRVDGALANDLFEFEVPAGARVITR